MQSAPGRETRRNRRECQALGRAWNRLHAYVRSPAECTFALHPLLAQDVHLDDGDGDGGDGDGHSRGLPHPSASASVLTPHPKHRGRKARRVAGLVHRHLARGVVIRDPQAPIGDDCRAFGQGWCSFTPSRCAVSNIDTRIPWKIVVKVMSAFCAAASSFTYAFPYLT